jgi:hypothetical protein
MSGYNGWKNWETWVTNLWHGDSITEHYLEMFREGNLTNPVEADDVKDYVESLLPFMSIPENGFVTDLVNGAMSEVDWQEIADHVEEAIKYEMENA